jgi:hypothetical protein
MAAHARHIEITKGTEELERSRRLLAEQERSLHVQMVSLFAVDRRQSITQELLGVTS